MAEPVKELKADKRWTFDDWKRYSVCMLDPKAKMVVTLNGKEYSPDDIIACADFYTMMESATNILFTINEIFKECPPDEETYSICKYYIDDLIDYIEDFAWGDYKCYQEDFLDEHDFGLKPMIKVQLEEFVKEIKKEKEEKKNARLDPVQK